MAECKKELKKTCINFTTISGELFQYTILKKTITNKILHDIIKKLIIENFNKYNNQNILITILYKTRILYMKIYGNENDYESIIANINIRNSVKQTIPKINSTFNFLEDNNSEYDISDLTIVSQEFSYFSYSIYRSAIFRPDIKTIINIDEIYYTSSINFCVFHLINIFKHNCICCIFTNTLLIQLMNRILEINDNDEFLSKLVKYNGLIIKYIKNKTQELEFNACISVPKAFEYIRDETKKNKNFIIKLIYYYNKNLKLYRLKFSANQKLEISKELSKNIYQKIIEIFFDDIYMLYIIYSNFRLQCRINNKHCIYQLENVLLRCNDKEIVLNTIKLMIPKSNTELKFLNYMDRNYSLKYYCSYVSINYYIDEINPLFFDDKILILAIINCSNFNYSSHSINDSISKNLNKYLDLVSLTFKIDIYSEPDIMIAIITHPDFNNNDNFVENYNILKIKIKFKITIDFIIEVINKFKGTNYKLIITAFNINKSNLTEDLLLTFLEKNIYILNFFLKENIEYLYTKDFIIKIINRCNINYINIKILSKITNISLFSDRDIMLELIKKDILFLSQFNKEIFSDKNFLIQLINNCNNLKVKHRHLLCSNFQFDIYKDYEIMIALIKKCIDFIDYVDNLQLFIELNEIVLIKKKRKQKILDNFK